MSGCGGSVGSIPGGVIMFFVVHMSIGYLLFASGPSHDVFISLLFFSGFYALFYR